MDGTRDVNALVEDTYYGKFDVASNLATMLEQRLARPASCEELTASASRCMEMHEPARAVRLMERALAQGADTPDLRMRLADVLVQLEENEKAAIHLGVVADGLAAQGQQEAAIPAYERVLALLPRHAATHEKLARIHVERGETAKAVEHYVSLVQSLVDSGRPDEAVAKCREGLALDAESTDLRSQLARVLLSSGDRDGAVAEFGLLAETYVKMDQIRTAVEVIRRIIHVDPRNRQAKLRLNELLSGKASGKKKSHLVRNLAIVLAVVAIIGGAFVVLHELAARHASQVAENDSATFLRQKKFAEARQAWAAVVQGWSFFDYKTPAHAALEEIARQEKEYASEVAAARQARKEAIARTFDEAREHFRKFETAQFEEKAALVMESEDATPEMKADAQKALGESNAREKEITDFANWRRDLAGNVETGVLDALFSRTRAIAGKYRGHPRLRELTLPLKVETDPSGAVVFVDDGSVGPAPAVIYYGVDRKPRVRVEMPGYDSERVNIPDGATVKVTLRRAVAWSFDAGSAPTSLTSGPGGLVLVTTQAGLLAAIDLGSPAGNDRGVRRAVWSKRVKEVRLGISSGVTIYKDVLYLGTDRLYAFGLSEDQPMRWAPPTAVGGVIQAPPAIGVARLINFKEFAFGTCVDEEKGTGQVWAVDIQTGERRWLVAPSEARRQTRSRPCIVGDNVLVAFDDGRVYGLDTSNGAVASRWQAGAAAKLTSPQAVGEFVWVGSADGQLYCLDPKTPGRPAAIVRVGWPIVTDLTAVGGVLYFGGQEGQVQAVDAEKRAPVWASAFKAPDEGKVVCAPAVGERRVYFATDKGGVYALDRQSGRLDWDYQLEVEVRGGVLFDGRYVCVGAGDEHVYAFDENLAP